MSPHYAVHSAIQVQKISADNLHSLVSPEQTWTVKSKLRRKNRNSGIKFLWDPPSNSQYARIFRNSLVFIFTVALKTSGNTSDNLSSNNYLIYYICTCRWKESNLGTKTSINKCKLQVRQSNWELKEKKLQKPLNVLPFPCKIKLSNPHSSFLLIRSPFSVHELFFLYVFTLKDQALQLYTVRLACKDQGSSCPYSNQVLICFVLFCSSALSNSTEYFNR